MNFTRKQRIETQFRVLVVHRSTASCLWFTTACKLVLFFCLTSHDRKHCGLIYCERKTLLNDLQIWLINPNKQLKFTAQRILSLVYLQNILQNV